MNNTTDYILNLPETTEFASLPEELQQISQSLGAEWPSFPLIGTRANAGRKLIHVRMKNKLLEENLINIFAQFGLDWSVVCIRSAYKEIVGQDENETDIFDYVVIKPIDKTTLLPFLNNITDGINENSNPIMRPPTLTDIVYLPTYAGTDPIEV